MIEEILLASEESIKEHRAELEKQYLWAITNIRNIEKMKESFEEENEILTEEEINAMEDGQDKNDAKTNFMAYDWIKRQLEDNVKAYDMHKENILLLNKALWV